MRMIALQQEEFLKEMVRRVTQTRVVPVGIIRLAGETPTFVSFIKTVLEVWKNQHPVSRFTSIMYHIAATGTETRYMFVSNPILIQKRARR